MMVLKMPKVYQGRKLRRWERRAGRSDGKGREGLPGSWWESFVVDGRRENSALSVVSDERAGLEGERGRGDGERVGRIQSQFLSIS